MLKVVRTSDLGYMLTDGNSEVLLHFKQASKELAEDEMVKVFVYSDKGKRFTATMEEPLATIEEAGFVEVVDVLPKVGVFVNINTPKDILISKDYLPFKEQEWPIVGDKLFIRLKVKADTLTGKPLNRFEIIELKTKIPYEEFQMVNGYICRIMDKGIGIITINQVYVFVPTHQYRGTIRLGQAVNVCITKIHEEECYGSLNAHKEELMDVDKETIVSYLKEHQGVMKLTSKSSAEEIEKLFQMSRKAFKRAYGNLYKEHLIYFDEEKTYLKEN